MGEIFLRILGFGDPVLYEIVKIIIQKKIKILKDLKELIYL